MMIARNKRSTLNQYYDVKHSFTKVSLFNKYLNKLFLITIKTVFSYLQLCCRYMSMYIRSKKKVHITCTEVIITIIICMMMEIIVDTFEERIMMGTEKMMRLWQYT